MRAIIKTYIPRLFGYTPAKQWVTFHVFLFRAVGRARYLSSVSTAGEQNKNSLVSHGGVLLLVQNVDDALSERRLYLMSYPLVEPLKAAVSHGSALRVVSLNRRLLPRPPYAVRLPHHQNSNLASRAVPGP